MRIDSHQHFWQYDSSSPDFSWIDESMGAIRRSFLPGDLAPQLAQQRFDGSIAVQAAQTEQENEFLLDLASQYDFIRGVVGWVDLRSPVVGESLDRLTQHPKFVGVRRIVQAEPAAILADADFNRGVRELSQRGLTYDLLIRQEQMPEAVAFVQSHESLKVVLDHVGKPAIAQGLREPWATHIKALGQLPHCYCKVSGLVTEASHAHWSEDDLLYYLEQVFDAFPPARLMFGSDWPVCLLAAPYARVLEVVEHFLEGASEDTRAVVFGDTAARFYGITER